MNVAGMVQRHISSQFREFARAWLERQDVSTFPNLRCRKDGKCAEVRTRINDDHAFLQIPVQDPEARRLECALNKNALCDFVRESKAQLEAVIPWNDYILPAAGLKPDSAPQPLHR